MQRLFCGKKSPQEQLFEDLKNIYKECNITESVEDSEYLIAKTDEIMRKKYIGTEIEKLARTLFLDIQEDIERRSRKNDNP